jgi:hypothetical protein
VTGPSRFHIRLDPLHRPGAQPQRSCDLKDADPFLKLQLHFPLNGGIDLRPSKLGALRDGTLEACPHPLPDHRALELGKSTRDLEHQLAHRSGRVDGLLVEVEINPDRPKVLDGAEEVDERRPFGRSPRPSPHRTSCGWHR